MLEAPLTGAPRLVIHNRSTVDIDVHGGYLVDERGEQGTFSLWPHPSDCPQYQPRKHLVPKGGVLEMPPPTRAYDSAKCKPGSALSPGRYILKLDSGYGEVLYASAVLDLPLTKPVRVSFLNHTDDTATCDATKAQRAARLVFAAAKARPGLPPGLLAGCDVARATCGTLPIAEVPPPPACTVTLHENLLRVDLPAGNDALRGLTAWTDRAVVYARRPSVTRTSASRVRIAGEMVTFEGVTAHHAHEHGGRAATIGYMLVRIHNPLSRPVSYSVQGMQWLVDFSCGIPNKVADRPVVNTATPSTLPPGTSELAISFAHQSAYMSHCERFASRAEIRVEGHTIAVSTEHEVTRYEPLDP